jgi:hypothetical protein
MQAHQLKTRGQSQQPVTGTTARAPLFRRVLAHCGRCKKVWTEVGKSAKTTSLYDMLAPALLRFHPSPSRELTKAIEEMRRVKVHTWDCDCGNGLTTAERNGVMLTQPETDALFVLIGGLK